MLSDDELIKHYAKQRPATFIHLARTPILDKSKHIVVTAKQLYVNDFNITGRPNGLWMALGSYWIKKVKGFNNPQYPLCCYIYEIVFKNSARPLVIKNDADFIEFDNEIDSYWLNMDYFGITFDDRITKESFVSTKLYPFNFNSLRKKDGETFWTIFINNNIIFTDPKTAKKHCAFYKNKKNMEQFKFKNWAHVASKYDYIMFQNWSVKNRESMKYFWYQTLDASTGCILNSDAIKDVKLTHHKVDATSWR